MAGLASWQIRLTIPLDGSEILEEEKTIRKRVWKFNQLKAFGCERLVIINKFNPQLFPCLPFPAELLSSKAHHAH